MASPSLSRLTFAGLLCLVLCQCGGSNGSTQNTVDTGVSTGSDAGNSDTGSTPTTPTGDNSASSSIAQLAALPGQQSAPESLLAGIIPGPAALIPIQGVLKRTTGLIALTDASGQALAPRSGLAATASFDFVTTFVDDRNKTGMLGVITPEQAIPNSNSAAFIGSARAELAQGSDRITLAGGRSIVQADFRRQLVRVTLGGFGTMQNDAGQTVRAPFDAVTATSMSMNGARFSGNQVSATLRNSRINPVGSATYAEAQGMFLGQTASGPDEVAGIIRLDGTEAKLTGYFMAD